MANSPEGITEYIKLNDFRGGIAQREGIAYPIGTATDTNTYRCIADDNGTLVPLPARETMAVGGDFASGPPDTGEYYVVGMFVVGPMLPESAAASTDNIELFVCVEYIDGGVRHFRTTIHRLYENPVTSFNIVSIDSTQTTPALPVRGVQFGLTRDNHTSPLLPGYPVVVWHWFSASGADEKKVWTYPDSANPDDDDTYEIQINATDEPITLIACHQGRVVLFKNRTYDHGENGQWTTNEDVYWTHTNDVSDVAQSVDSYNASIFVPENPTGYALALPMTANELFLVKAYGGGGLSVLGDLTGATVNNLPNLPSIGVDGIAAAYTDRGVVYGSKYSGAWLWAGGSSVEHLSPNLDYDFWFIPGAIISVNASWASWGEYVAGPNNWVFDPVQQSWWRLEDTAVHQYRWMRSGVGQPYALFGAITNYTAALTPIVFRWDINGTKANSYSWQSQPLPSTIDREIEVKEVLASLSGNGTVTITITGRDDNSSGTNDALTFTVNSTFPHRTSLPISVKGSFIQIRIESTGADGGPAPRVHGVEFGVTTDNIVPRNA